MNNGYTKTVPEVLAELRDELKEFANTRLAMLRSELSDKVASFKMAAPVLLTGVLLLGTAWLLLTGFLVVIIAAALAPNSWNYTVSFLVVGVLYAILGGVAVLLGWRQLREKGVKPERTIRVLQEDRVWLQKEGKAL
ncbi:MAG TPA: phage holin family protein [Candidatus Binatia bacterium]|nr:phage holin family protein [Candidatus Binatia bacterium]